MNGKTAWLLVILLSAGTSLGYTLEVKPGEDLVRARDRVRAARASGLVKPGEPVTVMLAPGEYRMSSGTLVFGREDSGSDGAPVVWRAEKPGTVSVVGGVTINASAFSSVRGDARSASFAPNVRNRILVANISKSLPDSLPSWPDAYQGMHPGPWLYQDGEPLEIAHWPNDGWATFDKVVDSGLTDDPKNEFAVRPGAFYLNGATNAVRWNLEEGVWCDGYWKHDWYEEVLRLAEYDAKKEVAKPRAIHKWGLLGNGTFGMKKRRFRVINVPAELDEPGEWWLDRERKRLYLLPLAGREGRPFVLVSAMPTFVEFKAAKWMRLESLSFAYSHGDKPCVSVSSSSRNVAIVGCRFSNFGGSALSIDGRDNMVAGCLIEKVGGDGILVSGGDRKNLVAAGNLVEKSEVRDYGLFNRTSRGIKVSGCGNAVRNCEIHHGRTGAIFYSGNEHLLAYNDIHHVLLETCDAGAIYTGRDASSQGNLLFGNYVHELGNGDKQLLAHRSAIYFDDCDWGDDVIGNRVQCGGTGILLGGGNMHRIHNNLFTGLTKGVSCGDRGVTWERRLRGSFLPDGDGHSWAEMCVLPFDYRHAPWHVAYPEIAALVDDRPSIPHSNSISGNVFQNCECAFYLSAGVQKLVDEMPIAGNSIVTNSESALCKTAPQLIGLDGASRTAIRSLDGRVGAEFFLDNAGRFSWKAVYDGATVIERSSLGVTVNYRDFGKLVVPGRAKFSRGIDAPTGDLRDDSNFEHRQTARGYEEALIPIRDLVTGQDAAMLEVRVFNHGVAFRWRVPGSGVRTVYGEMTTWNIAGGKLSYRRRVLMKGIWRYRETAPWKAKDGLKIEVHDAERGDMPRFRLQERGQVTGLVFPDYPSGWKTTGEIVTPWRVTLFGEQK